MKQITIQPAKMSSIFSTNLPFDTTSFSDLRRESCVYVDKTDILYPLASGGGKYLLTRPDGFGKSLLLSTFESLFLHGLRDFKGLKIEELWNEKKSYLVVRLDFSEVRPAGTFKEFRDNFDAYLKAQFKQIGFESNGSAYFSIQLETFLSDLGNASLVLLIDDYDAPLAAYLDNPVLFEKVSTYLSRFYCILKSNDNVLRFLFLTGLTPLYKTSLFSDFNDVSDISLSPEYGRLLGFSRAEVEHYFKEFLLHAEEKLNLRRKELIDKLEEFYGGFCFERTTKQKVIAPRLLLKFFSESHLRLHNYWLRNGAVSNALLNYLQDHSLVPLNKLRNEASLPLNDLRFSFEPQSVSSLALLVHMGYLTLKSIDGATAYVGYSNDSAKEALNRLFIE
ncbi:AAA family ATPase [uncultured Turicimonas sp.]|uniref:AAA family ATPase n=1 Tax=uncultured Turicimonas sp. TaxID=1918607 RepID=UPI00280581DB|nr:AAA family ATPase [uncultured Turicimonas sp.]